VSDKYVDQNRLSICRADLAFHNQGSAASNPGFPTQPMLKAADSCFCGSALRWRVDREGSQRRSNSSSVGGWCIFTRTHNRTFWFPI